jgi:thymidylate synthase
MQQYLDLLQTILDKGTKKPAAREGMPGTTSLFGYQCKYDLSKGFPILTTKQIKFKNIVTELLWFLRGDTNIKYLIDNGCNIWNEDAYNYYLRMSKQVGATDPLGFNEETGFLAHIREGGKYLIPGVKVLADTGYKYGDCGFQYGRVWREWEYNQKYMGFEGKGDPCDLFRQIKIDQIANLIQGLRYNPESRRHMLTSIDPAHDQDLSLYWCHCLVQFNARPLTIDERTGLAGSKNVIEISDEHSKQFFEDKNGIFVGMHENWHRYFDHLQVPRYHLDCHFYQRSADVFLGVPYNIASYALLTHIMCEMCNMVPGILIQSFGDVHIYDNHIEQVKTQLKREPFELPQLIINSEFWNPENSAGEKDGWKYHLGVLKEFEVDDFYLKNYEHYSPIEGKLSTGLK